MLANETKMHTSQQKINLKDLRARAAAKGIFTLSELARRAGCARPTVYFAVENPQRYSRVFKKLIAITE